MEEKNMPERNNIKVNTRGKKWIFGFFRVFSGIK
jgi:hypothetical protein